MIRTDRQTVYHGAMMTQRDRYFHFRFHSINGDCLRYKNCFQLF